MKPEELKQWFDKMKHELESGYLMHDEPWKQSGFSGSEKRWINCRKPVAECIDKSGSFLDIGCANGYLLECLMRWVGERGITIVPYGLDMSEKLIHLARQRLPQYVSNLFVGNAWYWKPHSRFDFVRSEMNVVPGELQREYLTRLLDEFVLPSGKLLISEYRSSRDDFSEKWIDGYLDEWGLKVDCSRSGFDAGKELTRVVVVQQPPRKSKNR
jgi:SAM-dependent methyltransferase